MPLSDKFCYWCLFNYTLLYIYIIRYHLLSQQHLPENCRLPSAVALMVSSIWFIYIIFLYRFVGFMTAHRGTFILFFHVELSLYVNYFFIHVLPKIAHR